MLARIASWECHELVAMQRPVALSTSKDTPRQPSMVVITGISSSSTNLMPSSMRSIWALMVVERA